MNLTVQLNKPARNVSHAVAVGVTLASAWRHGGVKRQCFHRFAQETHPAPPLHPPHPSASGQVARPEHCGPLALAPCKAGTARRTARNRGFAPHSPPRVLLNYQDNTNSPEAVLAVLASRYTPIDGHRVHALDPCDVAVREAVVVHDGPLRIAKCELGLACHTGGETAPLAPCGLSPEPGLLMPMTAPACPVSGTQSARCYAPPNRPGGRRTRC